MEIGSWSIESITVKSQKTIVQAIGVWHDLCLLQAILFLLSTALPASCQFWYVVFSFSLIQNMVQFPMWFPLRPSQAYDTIYLFLFIQYSLYTCYVPGSGLVTSSDLKEFIVLRGIGSLGERYFWGGKHECNFLNEVWNSSKSLKLRFFDS